MAARQEKKSRRREAIWSAKEVAEFVGVEEDVVYRHAGKEIPGFKVLGRWRFNPADVQAWFEAHTRKPKLVKG